MFLAVLSPWFFANVLATFLLTLWMPLAHVTKKITGDGLPEGGQVLGEATLPAYKVYVRLLGQPAAWDAWRFVALHIGVVLVITYVVWLLVLAFGKKTAAATEE